MYLQSLCGYEMKRLIILVWFLTAQIVYGSHVITIRKNINETQIELDIGNGEKLKNCSVITNEGKEFELYPIKTSDEAAKNLSIEHDNWFRYQFVINNPTVNTSGKWIIKTFPLKGEVKREQRREYNIQMKDIIERIEVIPKNKVTVYEGNLAIFKLPGLFPGMKSCILKNEDMEYDVLSKEYSDWKIQDPDVCGVRLPVNKSLSGNLYLIADVSVNVTYYAGIKIEVKNPETFKETIYLQIGKEGSIKLPKRDSFTYCQFEDPTGRKFAVQDKSCSHEIPNVTKSHEGLWIVYYGLMESMIPMKDNVTIKTYGQMSYNVTYNQNNDMELLCRVQWKPNANTNAACRFTRPDNLTLNVNPGIGYSRYEYYGSGYQRADLHQLESYDCGLTIRSPSQEDFGVWKCTIRVDNEMAGTIIRTDNSSKMSSDHAIKTYSSKIYVPRGKSFAIKCSTQNVLNYCWMLSPNGTAFVVSKNASSLSDLTYVGSGLMLGECGAIVNVADNTHMGEWTCRMGILNGTELETKVSVTVTESRLIADEKTIQISDEKPTILNCRVLPGYDNEIKYCRWIRPDGLGIHNRVDNKYVTEKTLSSCKLTITGINENFDVGTWFCAASFIGEDMMETTAKIQINRFHSRWSSIIPSSITAALMIMAVFLSFILFIIIFYVYRYKQSDDQIMLLQ